MQHELLDRRQWLKRAGLSTATAAAAITLRSSPARAISTTQPAADRKRCLRLAHLTDVHVEPNRAAGRGMAACLDHVHAQPDRPELILFGGDCVFDSMQHDAAHTQIQWDLWHQTLKDHCTIPAKFGIGNHDVWGWNQAKAGTTGNEPLYGKKLAMQQLGLDRTYYSFEQAGWHFIVLDSIFPSGNGYEGRLDDEQFAWLGADLAAVSASTPVLVQSHVPIFSVTPMVDPKSTVGTDTTVNGGSMHEDFRRIKALFRQHPNVKLALSGHTHFIDRVDYLGVTYLCDGAVSGSWWKGSHLGECDCGYGLIDLYEDGTFDHEYVNYGWTAVPDKSDI